MKTVYQEYISARGINPDISTGVENVQLMEYYFSRVLPLSSAGTYINPWDIHLLMTAIAAEMLRKNSTLSFSQLEEVVRKCNGDEILKEYYHNTARVIGELIDVFDLLVEENGRYRIADWNIMGYFGGVAIADKDLVDISDYLNGPKPDFFILLWCIRLIAAGYGDGIAAMEIIDYAIRKMAEFMEIYPSVLQYFSISEEMPVSAEDRSPFGSHIYFLVSLLGEYSHFLIEEDEERIYSLLLKVKNILPYIAETAFPGLHLDEDRLDN